MFAFLSPCNNNKLSANFIFYLQCYFSTMDSLCIYAQYKLVNVSLVFVLIFLSCPAETLSIAPVKSPSVVVCACYTMFVNTCKAMKSSSCFGISLHMMRTGLSCAVVHRFLRSSVGVVFSLAPTRLPYLQLSHVLFVVVFQSLIRLWAGQVGSEFPQQASQAGAEKSGPVPGGGDPAMELYLAGSYRR